MHCCSCKILTSGNRRQILRPRSTELNIEFLETNLNLKAGQAPQNLLCVDVQGAAPTPEALLNCTSGFSEINTRLGKSRSGSEYAILWWAI